MSKPRRTYTSEFKVRVVLEMITNKMSLSQASREYGIKDSVLSRWRQEFLERAPQVFDQPRA
jgi:transposase-like protein